MVYRRPKSYLLEVIVYHSVVGGNVVLEGRSTAQNVCHFFEHVASKWEKLMDDGDGVPRVLDPQLHTVISSGWRRDEFEAFMRRVREAAAAARKAVDADCDEDAHAVWRKVYPTLWPSEAEVENEALAAAVAATPGKAFVSSSGAISATATSGSSQSRPTTFHGPEK